MFDLTQIYWNKFCRQYMTIILFTEIDVFKTAFKLIKDKRCAFNKLMSILYDFHIL